MTSLARESDKHSHGIPRTGCCSCVRYRTQNVIQSRGSHNQKLHASDLCDYEAQFHGVAGTAPRCAACTEVQLTLFRREFVGGFPCVQYSVDRLRARERSTGILCAMFRTRNKLNKNKANPRTEMSGPSRASTAAASISAISRAWPGRTRPKATSHLLLASMRELRAAGLLTTTNHRPRRLASSSRR